MNKKSIPTNFLLYNILMEIKLELHYNKLNLVRKEYRGCKKNHLEVDIL